MFRIPKAGLILAGLAAFAYYKYNQMSEEEKRDLADNLKQKGQKLYDDYVPDNIKQMFGNVGKKASDTFAQSHFGEGSEYTG